jgi:uncharacterized membrane protein
MPKFCTSSYPILGFAAVIAFCLTLLLAQQGRMWRKKRLGSDRQSRRLLLIMFGFALLQLGLFFVYALSPQLGC